MYDFDDAQQGVNYSELAEEACELLSHLRIVSRPETRQLLDHHTDDTFRTHELSASNPRAVVGKLHTAYLIESAEIETGPYVDWTATDRAARLIDIVDEHDVHVTEAEADALLQVGARTWLLPEPDTWWTTADIDVDLHSRELATLESAGLLDRVIETGGGYSAVWRTSERLHSIATVVWRIIDD